MKKSSLILVSLLILSCGIPAPGQKLSRSSAPNSAQEQLIALEQQSWESVKGKDYKKFESFIADDFVDIFSNGQVVNKHDLLEKYIRGVELIDYALSKFRVVMLDKDSAIVVHEAVALGAENQTMAHDIKPGEVSAIHVAVTSPGPGAMENG
jgi:hypothetical protein